MQSSLDIFRRLVAFDSTSSNPTEPITSYIHSLFAGSSARIEEIRSEDESKANLLITLGGPTQNGSGLILSGHLDCVPARENGWNSDPFTLTDGGDRWIGRGASDMKGFIALSIDAALRVDASRLRAPLSLLFTYDEEVGTLGAKRFHDLFPRERKLPKACIIGEPTEMRCVRMHKGHLKLRVTLHGKSAHSGYPHLGKNAIEAAGRVIERLTALRMTLESERPEHHQFFAEVPFVPLNIGTIQGGAAINIVPDRCTIEIGLRPMPGMTAEGLTARVSAAVSEAAPDASVAILSNSPPMLLPEEADVHRTVSRLLGQSETESVGFATDAGWLQELGLDCVLFGPGSIEVAHRPNEYMPKAEFEEAAPLLDRLIAHYCGGEA